MNTTETSAVLPREALRDDPPYPYLYEYSHLILRYISPAAGTASKYLSMYFRSRQRMVGNLILLTGRWRHRDALRLTAFLVAPCNKAVRP